MGAEGAEGGGGGNRKSMVEGAVGKAWFNSEGWDDGNAGTAADDVRVNR